MIILFSIWKSSCSCFKNTQVFILHFPVHAELIIYYPPPLRDWGLFNMYWGHVVGTHTFMAHNVSEPRNPSKVQSDKTEVNFKLRTYFLHVERTTIPPSLESIAWNIFSKKEHRHLVMTQNRSALIVLLKNSLFSTLNTQNLFQNIKVNGIISASWCSFTVINYLRISLRSIITSGVEWGQAKALCDVIIISN